MHEDKKISVIIPCFNEEIFIGKTLNNLLELDINLTEIIIVDDCSSDKSVEIIKKLDNKKIKLITNKKNHGKGFCIRLAIEKSVGDIIIIQDADNEYNPKNIDNLLKPFFINKADFVIGNRFQSINYRKIGYFYQTLFNKIITLLVNIKTNKNFSDVECGYKLFTKKIVETIKLHEKSFGIEIELLLKIVGKNAKIYEVNVDYDARTIEDGKKIRFKDALRAIYCLLRY